VLFPGRTLGHDVCHHLLRRTTLQNNFAHAEGFSVEMVLDIDVLSMLVMLWIFRDGQTALVVRSDVDRALCDCVLAQLP
jgi:hypothetical protein